VPRKEANVNWTKPGLVAEIEVRWPDRRAWFGQADLARDSVTRKSHVCKLAKRHLQAADRNVPVRLVTASRGKSVRAEPISLFYEKGEVHHTGRFLALEDQLCAFSSVGYMGERSPDRADAAVWALSYVMLGAEEPVAIVGTFRVA